MRASPIVSLGAADNVAKRPRARIPANRSQAAGRYFDGLVSVERVSCRDAGGCKAGDSEIDYEVRGLEVRAKRGEPALIRVDRARTRGRGDGRRVAVDIELRPPDAPAADGELSLRPDRDLLDPENFEGTSLEDAFRQVRSALSEVTSKGQPLEKLTIVFRRGEVEGRFAQVVSMSAAGTAVLITLPVTQRPSQFRPSPTSQPQTFRVRAPPRKRRAKRVVALTEAPLIQVGVPNPGDLAQATEDVVGTVLAGVCESVGGTGCRPAAPPPLFVHILSPTLFANSSGAGELTVGCPADYEGVTGEVEIQSEVRLNERQRRLADVITFVCDEPQERLTFQLLEHGRDALRVERTLIVVVTVRIVTRDGRRAGDVDDAVKLRRSAEQSAPG